MTCAHHLPLPSNTGDIVIAVEVVGVLPSRSTVGKRNPCKGRQIVRSQIKAARISVVLDAAPISRCPQANGGDPIASLTTVPFVPRERG